MKQFLKEHWAIIVFLVTVVADNQYDILNTLIQDQHTIDVVKLIGTILLAVISPKYINFDKK